MKEPAQLSYEGFHARADESMHQGYAAPSWDECGPVGRNNWRFAHVCGNPDAVVEYEDESGIPEGAHVIAKPDETSEVPS